MAKTTAPLLSFDARGTIAKAQVYSSWRGISYARRWVQPANPNSISQQETRSTFSWLNSVWTFLPSLAIEGWDAFSNGQPFTGRNAWIKQNLSNLLLASDLSTIVLSPSAKSGPIAQAMTVTPGATQLTVGITEPSLPTGWSITSGIAAAIADQDPQAGSLFEVTAGEDLSTPFSIVLSGLTSSQLYRVGAWFKYTKPDGSFAYGRSLMDTGTPT